PPDHDDDARRHLRRPAAGARLGRRHRDAPAARHLHRRRAGGEPDPHPLHHPGGLSLPRTVPPMAQAQVRPQDHGPPPSPAGGGVRMASSVRDGGHFNLTPTLSHEGRGNHDHVPPPRWGRRGEGGILAVALMLGLTSCSVGPDYQKPDAPVATQFKELAGWKPAAPADAVDRGSWWTIYKDPVLDDLEKQIDISNQTLKESEAAYRQSRAVVVQARASFFPTLSGTGTAQRSYVGPGASRA